MSAKLLNLRNDGCRFCKGELALMVMAALALYAASLLAQAPGRGQTPAAANAGNKSNIFSRDSQIRHDGLNLLENGIISAARTPANFLIASEIFRC